MPITYDPSVLESFFGTAGEITEAPATAERNHSFYYTGPTLKYFCELQIDAEAVYICAGSLQALGPNTLYEICVPCSLVTARAAPDYAGGVSLSFFYGGSDVNQHRRLTILKDDASDLIVWPEYPFPPGHKYHLVKEK